MSNALQWLITQETSCVPRPPSSLRAPDVPTHPLHRILSPKRKCRTRATAWISCCGSTDNLLSPWGPCCDSTSLPGGHVDSHNLLSPGLQLPDTVTQ